MAFAVMIDPLDGMVLGEVSFDDPRVAPVATFRVETLGDFFDGEESGDAVSVRGKNPPGL